MLVFTDCNSGEKFVSKNVSTTLSFAVVKSSSVKVLAKVTLVKVVIGYYWLMLDSWLLRPS